MLSLSACGLSVFKLKHFIRMSVCIAVGWALKSTEGGEVSGTNKSAQVDSEEKKNCPSPHPAPTRGLVFLSFYVPP